MRIRGSNLKEYARSRLWVLPTSALVFTVILSQVALVIDRHAGLPSAAWYVFPGGPEGARELLSTVAASTFTFTALVFSITMVVLQLAATNLSPRVMRVFLRDLGTQVVLAAFLASFAYSLLILREVRSDDETFVPAFSIWIAFAFIAIDIALFIFYINHMTQRIRASSITAEIGTETLSAIERTYPEPFDEDASGFTVAPDSVPRIITSSRRGGSVTYVDKAALRDAAREKGVVIMVVPVTGDYIPRGGDLLRIWGGETDEGEQGLEHNVSLSRERTLQQDVGFGLRQLVDMGERALSPGVNDPTTAVQALDQVHEILSCLSTRAIPAGEDATDPHLIIREPTWDDYVRMGVDEIRLYGKSSIQVTRRLRQMLEDLIDHAPPSRHYPLRQQLALLDEAVGKSFESGPDRYVAALPSAQGNGPLPPDNSRMAGPAP